MTQNQRGFTIRKGGNHGGTGCGDRKEGEESPVHWVAGKSGVEYHDTHDEWGKAILHGV